MSSRKKPQLLVGAHMSIAGGVSKAIERGDSIGCTAIQIFTKSNRQWHAKKLTVDEIAAFKKALRGPTSVKVVVAHASYLVNIGAANREVEKKSVASLVIEVQRCEALGIPYLVVHPGSHVGTTVDRCLEQIARNLDFVLNKVPGSTKILLENMAGQGSTVCYNFEQLAAVRKMVKNKRRVGFCFDTCHGFAAGYEFNTPAAYKQMWKSFDEVAGLNHLKVIHMNDSEKGLGCRVDRHEAIGKGKLGLEPFRLIMNDPAFFSVPKILETPKKTIEDDLRNLRTLERLMNDGTKKKLGL